MMQQTENIGGQYRTGNYFENNGVVMKVVTINFYGGLEVEAPSKFLEGSQNNIDNLAPILMNDWWYEKLGFEKIVEDEKNTYWRFDMPKQMISFYKEQKKAIPFYPKEIIVKKATYTDDKSKNIEVDAMYLKLSANEGYGTETPFSFLSFLCYTPMVHYTQNLLSFLTGVDKVIDKSELLNAVITKSIVS